MADTGIVEFLIGRARDASDQCARALAQALRRETSDRRQLDLLEQYRADYRVRYAQVRGSGTSLAAMRNFEAFLHKLDQAIEQQRRIVAHAEAGAQNARGALGEAERKRQSMVVLRDRRAAVVRRAEARTERLLNDEFANRATCATSRSSVDGTSSDTSTA